MRNKIKRISFLSTILLLTGCSVGHYEYSKTALNKTDMNFIGIPTVLGVGMLGSSVPITPEYSLTAAHVAKYMMYKVKSYHPTCDLAIIYHKNKEKEYPKLRNSIIGENINMYGYSMFTAMPVESTGKTLINVKVNSKWNKDSCILTASNSGVVQGMSGGAVYNNKDHTLAGIIQGYSSSLKKIDNPSKELYKNVSLYIPYKNFSDWLEKEIGNQSNKNNTLIFDKS